MTVSAPTLGVAQARLSNPTIGAIDYAVLIEVSVDIVYDAIHNGSIPVIKHGQRYRIPSAWVRQQLHLDDQPAA